MRPGWLSAGFLVLITFAVYCPVLSHDFINYDDPSYVTSNSNVQSGLTWHNVQSAFCQPVVGNWHPATMLSHMLDCQIYGLEPRGHHLTNVLLHAANTALVFLLLFHLTSAKWRSWFVAALFGLHPLHVESVAWVAERKDVLSTFFGLLCLIAYANYAQAGKKPSSSSSSSPSLAAPKPREGGSSFSLAAPKPGEGGSSLAAPKLIASGAATEGGSSFLSSLSYWLSLLFFTLSLMSKPMLVTLPFVLLLLDYWPLARTFDARTYEPSDSRLRPGVRWQPRKPSGDAALGRNLTSEIESLWPLVKEKIPFLALAAVMSVVTYLIQRQTGLTDSLETMPPGARIGNALISYFRYLGKLFWPTNLAVFYPYPEHNWPMVSVLPAGVVLTGISLLVFLLRARHPYLLAGWLWFCGTLIPVIGLVQLGGQAMADRYTYFPSLGIFILLLWGMHEMTTQWKSQAIVLGGAGCLAIILCASMTWQQLGYWQNNETLYRHALAVTKNNYRAHLNLGIALFNQAKFDDAIVQYQEAVRLKPDRAEAHYNLGAALSGKGETDDALTQFRQAVQLEPNDPTALSDLGAALADAGKLDEAKTCFQKALQISPQDALLHNNWGKILLEEGQLDAAIQEFHTALAFQPDFALALFNLGNAEGQSGNLDAAVQEWQKAVEIQPGYAAAYNNLGNAMMRRGELDLAVREFQLALNSQPDLADARNNLAGALLQEGQVAEAIQQWHAVLALRPDFVPPLNNLAWVLAACPDDSLRDGAKALRLAQHANQLASGGNPLSLRALAAAYAENGGFENAVSNAELAIQLATSRNQAGLAQSIQQQLECYRRHQPFRDPALTPRQLE